MDFGVGGRGEAKGRAEKQIKIRSTTSKAQIGLVRVKLVAATVALKPQRQNLSLNQGPPQGLLHQPLCIAVVPEPNDAAAFVLLRNVI